MPTPLFGPGCAPLGNLFRRRTDEDCHATPAGVWQGVRRFDTAPHYGLGLSEERPGRLLVTRPRAEFVVSTNPRVVSVVAGAGGPVQVEQSLDRLATTVPDAVWTDLADEGLVSSCA
jgi:aryl-alcohol dehydrogenase-like predicted oxidoreductase